MNNFIKKTLERDKFLVLLFFLILSLFFFRKVIVSPGTVGHLLDWPFPSEVKELQTYFNEAFYTWRSHSLGYSETFMVISLWGGFWGFFGLLGFSGEWVSKFCLLSLIPLAGFSMYLLLNELFPISSKEKKINLPAFLGSLFYAVSPVMINQILGGAVLYLLSYGLSPLGLLIFIKGVDDKGINWPCGILLALLWAIAGIDNHFLIFWGILFLTYPVFTKERRIMYLKFLGFAVFLVFILYSYWLVGFFLNYRSNSTTFQTTGANEVYLLNLAAHSGPFTSVITLIANFNPILFKAVMSPHLIKAWFLASFTLLVLIFSSSLLSLRKKNVLYALLIIIIGIFLAKGVYQPFASINLWLYRNFVPMNLFRTLHHIQFFPVFGYSILVGSLFEYVRLKFKRRHFILFMLFFLALLAVYVHPLLTGNINNGVFTFQEPKSLTRIKETMDNLDKKPNYGGAYRILFFPISGSVGFKGQRMDLAPGGSFPTVINSPRPTLNAVGGGLGFQLAQYIEKNIYVGNFDGYIAKLLALAGVRYLIPRNDLIYLHLSYGVNFWNQKEAYQKLLDYLNRQQELIKINSYSDMSLWENKDFLPHFYIPRNIIYSNGDIENLADIVEFGNYETRSGIYLDENGKWKMENGNLTDRADEVFVKAELENAVTEEKLGINLPIVSFPYVRNKPGSLMYRLVLLNENFDKWENRKDPEKLFEKHLFYASKRIAELGKWGNTDIGRYREEMMGALGELRDLRELGNKDFSKLLTEYQGIIAGHLKKLRELREMREVREWEALLKELEKEVEGLKTKRDFSRLVYKVEIPKEGEYEIFVKNTGSMVDFTSDPAADYSLLGKRYFEKGAQELVLPMSGISGNLVDENLKIKDYQPDAIYRISFDYGAPKGGGFFIAEGKAGEQAETNLLSTDNEIKHFEMFFRSSAKAEKGEIHLSLSIAQEKNLKVERIYQSEVMLRSSLRSTVYGLQSTPKITFVKINPTKYRVKVEGASQPYTLVFSESFHQGWKAYINKVQSSKFKVQSGYGEIIASYFDGEIKEGTHRNILLEKATFETWGKKALTEDRHLLVNGYANSWYIKPEDSGGDEDYEVIIEFAPQRLFYIGLGISLATLLGCLGYLGIDKIRAYRYNKN